MKNKKSSLTYKQYTVPFVFIISLFFLWGFARAILDVLNKHFQTFLDISITQSSMIQVATYLGYFIMALPAGIYITKFGYRRGIVTGLILYAIGAFLFIPCMWSQTFSAFVFALFIIGCGLTFLEVSANPYVTFLGPNQTSSSRLNFAQSFNGLGCVLAPLLVGQFLFTNDDADVSIPYVIMGFLVLVAALVFSRVPLPSMDEDIEDVKITSELGGLLKKRTFLFGLISLLAYEVSEISINSYFVNFTTGMGWLSNVEASNILALALVLFMIGRFVGSWIMRFITAEKMLLTCAVGTVTCMTVILLNISKISLYALILNYMFEAIMFPTIFCLTLKGLSKKETKCAGSILMMTPVGGCAFLLMGIIADSTNLIIPFILPLLGFIVVVAYAQWLCHNYR